MWVKITGNKINLDRDLYMCLVYIKPHASPEILEQIEIDITKYTAMGEIILMGDFNSRTGDLNDYISGDASKHLPLSDSYIVDDELPRANCDTNINMLSKSLIELCASTNMRILNGRYTGDSLGFYTCFKHNGSSTVDYIIASSNILHKVTSFRVEPYLHLSDHGLL